MKRSLLRREVLALLPWLAATFLWFFWITPLRADQENRLFQQGQVRRERVKADRALREAKALRERVGDALRAACRASADPAALRQRTIAATAGLSLSPMSLSVAGGPGGGASVEAGGTRSAVVELLRRLGDPTRGGFLRSAAVRNKGARQTMSATTGVLVSFSSTLADSASNCAPDTGPDVAEAQPQAATTVDRPGPRRALAPTLAAPRLDLPPSPVPSPPPPFTLIAFLFADGKGRVSLRVGDQVRVIAPGEEVEGWKCVSIDRDDGAIFTSSSGGRLVLKAGR